MLAAMGRHPVSHAIIFDDAEGYVRDIRIKKEHIANFELDIVRIGKR
jgi:hypothetical protein